MVNLAYHAEVLKLLAEIEAMAADLTPNELEMLSHLRSKYAVPDHGDFDDKICLEVMLRNVAIRRGIAFRVHRVAARVIEVTRTHDVERNYGVGHPASLVAVAVLARPAKINEIAAGMSAGE